MACAIQSFTLEECTTQGFPLYDQYADIFLRPDLRKSIIKRANLPNFMLYLFDWRRELFGGGVTGGERIVTTREYMWEEINFHTNPFQFAIEATNAVGGAGAPVTATIIRPLGPEGQVTVAVGYTVWTGSGEGIVQARVTDLTDDQIELTPINGQALDFTGYNRSFTFDPNYVYDNDCDSPIPTNGFSQSQPQVGVGVIQKYENGICICDNALSHYGYNFVPAKMQMQDPLTGNYVDTWCLPEAMQNVVTEKMFYGQFSQMMFGQFDYTQDAGINGLIPTILNQGGYNMPINTMDANSVVATLKIIAKEYYRLNITSFELWCDYTMYTNLNQALASLIGPNNFSLPIWNGHADNNGHIEWYGFRTISNFLGTGIDLKINMIGGWEAMGFNQIYQDFAILMPSTNYVTQDGMKVPQIEITRQAGCEAWALGSKNSYGSRMWYWDDRITGKSRKLDIFAQNSFGMDIHGLPFMGILTGNQCFTNQAVYA